MYTFDIWFEKNPIFNLIFRMKQTVVALFRSLTFNIYDNIMIYSFATASKIWHKIAIRLAIVREMKRVY